MQTVPDECLQVRCPHCTDTVREVFAVQKRECVKDLPKAQWRLLDCHAFLQGGKSKIGVRMRDKELEEVDENGIGNGKMSKPVKTVIRLKKHNWIPYGMWLRNRLSYYRNNCVYCLCGVWPYAKFVIVTTLFTMLAMMLIALSTDACMNHTSGPSSDAHLHDGGSDSFWNTLCDRQPARHAQAELQPGMIGSVPSPPPPEVVEVDDDSYGGTSALGGSYDGHFWG